MEAIQIASAAPNRALHCSILAGAWLLKLVSYVFHDDSEDPNDSQEEWAKCQAAEVVSQSPPEASWKRELASDILCWCEVPSACGNDNNITEVCLDELVDPEEGEDLWPKHSFNEVIVAGNLLQLTSRDWLLNVAGTE